MLQKTTTTNRCLPMASTPRLYTLTIPFEQNMTRHQHSHVALERHTNPPRSQNRPKKLPLLLAIIRQTPRSLQGSTVVQNQKECLFLRGFEIGGICHLLTTLTLIRLMI